MVKRTNVNTGIKCLNCGKIIIDKHYRPYHKRKYCSNECVGKFKLGKTHIEYFGKELAEKISQKQRESKLGDKHPLWVGDKVCYAALHKWVSRHKPKPKFCELCLIQPPKDLSNISGEYKRDINDFEWLCRKCHRRKDIELYKKRGFYAIKKKLFG